MKCPLPFRLSEAEGSFLLNVSQVVGSLHTLFVRGPWGRPREGLWGAGWVLSAGVGLLVLNGCAPFSPRETAEPPPPVYRFEDVPIPPNFEQDASESFIFETPTLKAGIIVYRGTAGLASVVEFFKGEMPKYGWTLIHSVEHREAHLSFEKEGWSCTVRVNRGGLKTTVEIVIGPKGEARPTVGRPRPEGQKAPPRGIPR